MEDLTASANDDDDDDDDDSSSDDTFHDDQESSTTQGTGAASAAAAAAAPSEVPQTKEVRFSLSHVSSATDGPASAETIIIPPFEPLQKHQPVRAGGSLRSASVTRQVLSSPDSDADSVQPQEPRYLRYRDSLRTSLQKSASTNASASAARDSLASSDDTTPIKDQLLSYFDKSLPPAIGSARGSADGAASEPM
jgi:hypothetical protein